MTKTSCATINCYPKYEVWAIKIFCGTIPFSSQIPPLVYDVGGPVVDGACNRFGGKPIAEAGAECQ